MATTMAIKLEMEESDTIPPISNPIQSPKEMLIDKKPIFVTVVRANEDQLSTLNAAFVKTDSPKKAELDIICNETGLYVFICACILPQKRRFAGRCLVDLPQTHSFLSFFSWWSF